MPACHPLPQGHLASSYPCSYKAGSQCPRAQTAFYQGDSCILITGLGPLPSSTQLPRKEETLSTAKVV